MEIAAIERAAPRAQEQEDHQHGAERAEDALDEQALDRGLHAGGVLAERDDLEVVVRRGRSARGSPATSSTTPTSFASCSRCTRTAIDGLPFAIAKPALRVRDLVDRGEVAHRGEPRAVLELHGLGQRGAPQLVRGLRGGAVAEHVEDERGRHAGGSRLRPQLHLHLVAQRTGHLDLGDALDLEQLAAQLTRAVGQVADLATVGDDRRDEHGLLREGAQLRRPAHARRQVDRAHAAHDLLRGVVDVDPELELAVDRDDAVARDRRQVADAVDALRRLGERGRHLVVEHRGRHAGCVDLDDREGEGDVGEELLAQLRRTPRTAREDRDGEEEDEVLETEDEPNEGTHAARLSVGSDRIDLPQIVRSHRPDSNRCTRLCRPLPNHSATVTRGAGHSTPCG